MPQALSGLRDRALVLVGYAGAFRRSELAAIGCAHLSFTKDGLVIDLHRSKTDQEASGRKVGISLVRDDFESFFEREAWYCRNHLP